MFFTSAVIFCNFSFIDYPFDCHECTLIYGDKRAGLNNVIYASPEISFGNILHKEGDEPIIFDHLPFQFEIKSLPNSTTTPDPWGFTNSRTGILFTMKRNDFGKLLASYYYPMASFAGLSLVSFLINPDVVSSNTCLTYSIHIKKDIHLTRRLITGIKQDGLFDLGALTKFYQIFVNLDTF